MYLCMITCRAGVALGITSCSLWCRVPLAAQAAAGIQRDCAYNYANPGASTAVVGHFTQVMACPPARSRPNARFSSLLSHTACGMPVVSLRYSLPSIPAPNHTL
jgi:hypothetical protein